MKRNPFNRKNNYTHETENDDYYLNETQKKTVNTIEPNKKKTPCKNRAALRGVAIQRGRAARTAAVFPPAGATATAFRLPTPLATAAAASSANALHGFAP